MQATCPVTCGSCTPCADNDARAIALASRFGYTISGCASTEPFCEHAAYGGTVRATCPLTCGSCTAPVRRLADGKDPNADELDWLEEVTVPQAGELDRIDELTVVTPTAEVTQGTEEVSNSGLFYP